MWYVREVEGGPKGGGWWFGVGFEIGGLVLLLEICEGAMRSIRVKVRKEGD
jgi:hypothetical protein